MAKSVKNEYKDIIFLIKDDYPIDHIKCYVNELSKPNKRDMNYIKKEFKNIFKKYEDILCKTFGDYDLFEINHVKEKTTHLPIKEKFYYLWLNHRYIDLKEVAFYMYNLQNMQKFC